MNANLNNRLSMAKINEIKDHALQNLMDAEQALESAELEVLTAEILAVWQGLDGMSNDSNQHGHLTVV